MCEDGTCIVILICEHTHGDGKSEKNKYLDQDAFCKFENKAILFCYITKKKVIFSGTYRYVGLTLKRLFYMQLSQPKNIHVKMRITSLRMTLRSLDPTDSMLIDPY
jgi:hypothetical protein